MRSSPIAAGDARSQSGAGHLSPWYPRPVAPAARDRSNDSQTVRHAVDESEISVAFIRSFLQSKSRQAHCFASNVVFTAVSTIYGRHYSVVCVCLNITVVEI